MLLVLLTCLGAALGGGLLLYARLVPSEESAVGAQASSGPLRSIGYWRNRADEAYVARQWEAAIPAYEEVIQRNPDSVPAWVRLAYSLHCSGQLDRALAAHLQVSRFPAARAWGLYNIACIYALRDEKQLALDYLHDAIEAGFQSERSIEEDPDLQNLLGEAAFGELVELAKPLHLRSRFRQLDFLVGNWYITGDDSQRQGRLDVRRSAARHGLVGEYRNNALPLHATILSYFEPAEQQWRQIWLERHGGVIELNKFTARSNSLQLEGMWTSSVGERNRARVVYEVSPDRKRLKLERSFDNGLSWEPVVTSNIITPASDTASSRGG
jgi:tetratricopeptide (TPR) repeat protein